MRHLRKQRYILLTVAACIFGVFSFLGSADASKWFFGSDTELSMDFELTYTATVRAADQPDKIEPGILSLEEYGAYINQDDADRNFEQWDLSTNKVVALADIELIWKNFGAFVRPKAFYDHVYMSDNANDSPETNNAYQAGMMDSSDEWSDEIEDIHGMNAEILDLFAYTNFRLGNVPFDVRVGKQVISWGENTFSGVGISGAQSPVDASVAQAVGTEVKEIFLPTGAVYVQTGYGDVGLRAYYQWEWEKTKLMEGGTFLSQADMLDEIKAPTLGTAGTAEPGTAFAIPRGEDEEAKDDGQYGFALSYMLPWNATEVSVFYLNYHDHSFAGMVTAPDYSEYHVIFAEDIKLYGLTVGTCIGDTQVYAETSYRDGIMFQNLDTLGIGEGGFFAAVTGFVHVLSPLWVVADRFTTTAEIAYGAQTDLEDTDAGSNEEGFAYTVYCMAEWFQVFQRTDFTLDLKFQDVPKGTIKTFNLSEDASAYSIGLKATYNDVWEGGFIYENRFQDHALKLRDTLSFTLKYSF